MTHEEILQQLIWQHPNFKKDTEESPNFPNQNEQYLQSALCLWRACGKPNSFVESLKKIGVKV